MTTAGTSAPNAGGFRNFVAAETRSAIAREGISQRRLAMMLGESSSWVSRRFSGEIPIDTVDLDRIAAAVGISVWTLLGVERPTYDGPTGAPIAGQATREYVTEYITGGNPLAQIIDFPTHRTGVTPLDAAPRVNLDLGA